MRRGLNQVTLSQPIEGGQVLLDRTIAHPSSVADFLAGLQGYAIAQWHRRGKYLLAELVQVKSQTSKVKNNSSLTHSPTPSPTHPFPYSPPYLGVHLRMTGQLLWVDRAEPLPIHTRVRLFFAGNRELRFVDQRTFGRMWWVPPHTLPASVITGLQRLGPEPLSPEFTVDYLVEQFRDRRRPIKNALLDQEITAGVGNIYADESLFISGIRPTTLCATLQRDQIARLREAIVTVLQESIGVGGTTFSNFVNVQGINGNYGGNARVYDRDGEPCLVCQTPIERLKLAGRSTHFCPVCQP